MVELLIPCVITFLHTQSPSPMVRANSRPLIELKGGVTWARLTTPAESGAEFLEITYALGALSDEILSHHEGREFGMILEGKWWLSSGLNLMRYARKGVVLSRHQPVGDWDSRSSSSQSFAHFATPQLNARTGYHRFSPISDSLR